MVVQKEVQYKTYRYSDKLFTCYRTICYLKAFNSLLSAFTFKCFYFDLNKVNTEHKQEVFFKI